MSRRSKRGGAPRPAVGRSHAPSVRPTVGTPSLPATTSRLLAGRGGAVVAFLVYLVGAFLLTGRAWASPTASWPGICCDQAQAIWFLGWVPYALTHGLDPFFTPMLNAPDGVNLMWNSGMPLLSVVAWLPTLIGGPVFAFTVLLTLSIAASGWTAWLVLRRYAGDGLGPLVGGAVYAFSPYVASHAALHLNLTAAFVPPLFLLVLDDLLVRDRRPAWRLGIALGLLSGVQLLVAEEILATSVIASGVLVAVLAAARPALVLARVRRVLAALGAATVTFLVVGGWPLAAQFLGPQRITEQVQDAEAFSTDLLNVVLPTPYQLIAPDAATAISRDFSTLYHEATAYLGVPLLVLLGVVAVTRWADLRVRVATLAGAILLVLSFGPRLHVGATDTGLPMPWAPFGELPLLEHVLPGRFTLFVWLAAAAIVAIVVGELARRPSRQAAPRLAAVGLALLVILPAPLGRWSIEVPAFFREWPAQRIGPDETVLVAPYFHGGALADPMVWAAYAGMGVRMPESYAYVPDVAGGTSVGTPRTQLADVMETIQDDGLYVVARGAVRAQIAEDLAAADVRHVIVGPMAERDPMVAFFTDLFGRPPDEDDGISIWRHVDVEGVAEPPAE